MNEEELGNLDWTTITHKWSTDKRRRAVSAAVFHGLCTLPVHSPPVSTVDLARAIVLSGVEPSDPADASRAVSIVCRELLSMAFAMKKYARLGAPHERPNGQVVRPWKWTTPSGWKWWDAQGKDEPTAIEREAWDE